MACGYCPVLFYIDVLGIKQISGTVTALLSWLQEARTASTGFSSVFLLFMLTVPTSPPLHTDVLHLYSACLSLQIGENKLDSGELKDCKWLLIPRPLAFLEVGVRKGVCFGTEHAGL